MQSPRFSILRRRDDSPRDETAESRREIAGTGRWLLLAVAVGIAGLILVARILSPDSRGFGTHEQLGLSPCNFYQTTGFLCPACGATTAWAHLLRGNLPTALETHVAGTTLGLAAIGAIPWLVVSAARGNWTGIRPTWDGVLLAGSAWMLLALADWLRRVWLS